MYLDPQLTNKEVINTYKYKNIEIMRDIPICTGHKWWSIGPKDDLVDVSRSQRSGAQSAAFGTWRNKLTQPWP